MQQPGKKQVVLFNFGGPEKAEEVSPFLFNLFNDPFIIRTPLWGFLRSFLAKMIVKKRAANSIAEYQEIGFSPINRYTNFQCQALTSLIQKEDPHTEVLVINRYTAPRAELVVENLDPQGSLYLLCLYPHFCHSTTASSLKDFSLALASRFGEKVIPRTTIYSWWSHPTYRDYLLSTLRAQIASFFDKARPLTVLFSAHGIPEAYSRRGDPYVSEIYGQFEFLRKGLSGLSGRDEGIEFRLSFQSRVGPVRWVTPYTENVIAEIGGQRGGDLFMVPISFVSDHIETLYEMDVTYKDLALKSGFDRYQRSPGHNDDVGFTECLLQILKSHGF
jgi:protoporphyrin/coproporphyrin ferrochelatase